MGWSRAVDALRLRGIAAVIRSIFFFSIRQSHSRSGLVQPYSFLALVASPEVLIFCPLSVHMCLCSECGVAWGFVCPVPARGVFNNVSSVAISGHNKGFLTALTD